MKVNFGDGTGAITANAENPESSQHRSSISGDIHVDNMTWDFKTPDGESLEIILTEPKGVAATDQEGTRMTFDGVIHGQFSSGSTPGVHGIWNDKRNRIIHGAIIGSRQ